MYKKPTLQRECGFRHFELISESAVFTIELMSNSLKITSTYLLSDLRQEEDEVEK